MKVIVCGGRDYNDSEQVFAALDKAHAKRPLSMVVHGSSGAGMMAEHWAQRNGVLSARVTGGDVLACDPDGVIAMPGAPAALLEKAREAGVKVWCPFGEGNERAYVQILRKRGAAEGWVPEAALERLPGPLHGDVP